MNQASLLLSYRTLCNTTSKSKNDEIYYDITMGLWIDKTGEPLIKSYFQTNRIETLLTETREGIDRSELSNIDNNEKELYFLDNTVLTFTRESIDRSEKTEMNVMDNNYEKEYDAFGETLITRTRESVDRSERANICETPCFQTIETCTRESIDRSEKT